MKATIDFDESLYRRLKIEAATRGRTIRDLVDEGVRLVLGLSPLERGNPTSEAAAPEWFGVLHEYAAEKQAHDLPAIRKSIVRGRSPKKR